MIRKILEAFFRHKLLILVPPILVPLLVAPIAFLTTPTYYEAAAGIWVDQPTFLDLKSATPGQFTSAAASQSAQLTELLKSRAFMLDVANRTPLSSVLTTKGGEARVQDMFDKNLTVAPAPSGTHLLIIRFKAPNGQLAQQVTQAVIDAYQERTANQQLDQSGVAISFYQSQLQSAQDDLTKATQDMAQYAMAMGYASADGGGPAQADALSPSALDPRFAELQSTAKFDQQQVDTARAALQQAEMTSAAASQGSQINFQVLDPPQLPTVPTSNTKNLIVFVAAALVLGFGISAMALVFLVAGDRSVRRDGDLQPPIRILGVLPNLKVNRLPKNAHGFGTRRAIGFVAGTALPAPRGASK